MVNGILNVYKEPYFTSFDVVAKLRGMLKIKKIGHTGTLDPEAVGVLPVCIGNATKVCELLTDETKEYIALLRLGITTDTLDTSGKVLSDNHKLAQELNYEDIKNVIYSFKGEIEQIPPMYSALKVNGQKLYDLARKGIEVERKARKVRIDEIEIVDERLYQFHEICNGGDGDVYTFSDEMPEDSKSVRIAIRVVCTKGTYIRTLCDDIGKKLGCGGCMEGLIRSRVGAFSLDNAYTLSDIQKMIDEGMINDDSVINDRTLIIKDIIKPVDDVFFRLARIYIVSQGLKALINGNKIPCSMISESSLDGEKLFNNKEYRVYDHEGRFFGIYTYIQKDNVLKPVKMFIPE